MKLVLEARHLFDGSLHAVAKHATDVGDHDRNHFEQTHVAERHITPPATVTVSPTLLAEVPALAANPNAHEILFVDTRVANWETLASSVKSDVQVVLIDPTKNGIDQVTAALKGHDDLTAIHFLTYGQPGQLELGNTAVTAAALSSHAAAVASWGDHLAAGGDIEFWGCDVGQGSAGQSFVDTVHALTGAQVGASTDATGAASLGGDWNLERTSGALAVGVPFSADAVAAYRGVLDAPTPVVAFDATTVAAGVLLGGSFTETLTFQNTASSGVGYGPFVDLFVPTKSGAAQTVSLDTATYLGSAVTTDAVVLSDQVPGHVGTVGALHPLAVGTDGKPLFIAAPAGYQAGDTMYVLTLPFGSFTPGEPAARIALTFDVADTTELSSAHNGQAINIEAIGGFQFGADALNNPATDPSIRGTTGAPTTTDASDGLVTASTAVTLLDVSATTDLHESETATGPDYPFNYIVTLKPASVTQSDPITGFDFTFTLPDQVQYTNGTIAVTGPGGATGTATFHAGSTAVGGSVTVHFTSLGTDGADTPTLIKIPVFVPLDDASGNAILNATTGAARLISNPNIYSYTGTWDAVPGSLDHGVTDAVAGDNTTDPTDNTTDFTAKSLAIQVSDNGGSILPGQVVDYTINFQVSDYFSLANLNIANLLSDGLTLLAPGQNGYAAPTLSITRGGTTVSGISFGDAGTLTPDTVNGQLVAESGSAANWSYSRDDANTGVTTMGFNVGGLLQAHFGSALDQTLQGSGGTGATEGSITFTAMVLDKYTNTFGLNPIRERDGVSDTLPTTGTSANVVTVSGGVATPTGSAVSDDSGASNSVAPGTLTLVVVAVNGAAANANTVIHPGDNVTYEMTYTLSSGDYGDLNLTSYLPLPVFSTSDPTATGSTVTSYALDNTTPNDPAAGKYRLISPLSGESVVSTTVGAVPNSFTVDFGDRSDPTNATGQQVIVDFTVVASNQPYANGLLLTNLAGSTYTNAAGATAAAAAIKQVTLAEPELEVKTGVVSVVGDNGTTAKGTYSADASNPSATWTAQNAGTSPTSQFAPAGTAAGTLFANGGTAAGALPVDDLNVANVDANDTARVVSTVENQGNSTAFDVTLHGTLPTGYATSDVSNFAVYNSSGTRIETGITSAQYFANGGVKLSTSLAAGDTFYVAYDIKVRATQLSGATLQAGGDAVNWANFSGGVAAGQGFVSGGQPLGETAAFIADDATVAISAPTFTKTLTSVSDGDVPLGTANDVTLGETVTYTLTITLPEGVTADAAAQTGDVIVTDSLPAAGKLTFVSIDQINYGTVSHSGGSPTATGAVAAGSVNLTVDLGQTLTNNNDAPATITIVYTAVVADGRATSPYPGTPGTSYANSASFHYDNGTGTTPAIAASPVTVTEVDPNVAEALSVSPAGNVYSNETLTYTVTLTNSGNATAENLADEIDLPTGLTYVAGSLTAGTAVGTGLTTSDTSATTLEIGAAKLSAGAAQTYTFQVTVDTDQPAGQTLTVQTPDNGTAGSYYSLPGTHQGQEYTDAASKTVSVATFTPHLGIIGEANDTSGGGTGLYTTAVSAVDATIGDIVRYSAYVQVPEGENSGAQLTVDLPSGMTLDGTAGSFTILLVSPNGSLSSTNASNPAQVSYTGTFDPTGAIATTTLDASHVSSVVNGNGTTSVTFNLGTLRDNESSANPDYVIVQFNGIVANKAAVHDGASLAATVTTPATATAVAQTSGAATVAVEEPDLAISKSISSASKSGGVTTVTITETVTNTGDATAYNVDLSDPEGSNVGSIGSLSTSGSGALTTIVSGDGTNTLHLTGTIGVGQSDTITYTETVTDPTQGVADATATVKYTSLQDAAAGTETLAGTSNGASGSATGSRDGSSGTSGLNDYEAQASVGLGVVTGNIWNDIGSPLDGASATFGSGVDTELAGVTVTGSWTGGGTSSVVTDASGNYAILLSDGSGLGQTIAVPTTSGAGASQETLVFDTASGAAHNHSETGLSSGGASLAVTPSAATPVSAVDFVYRLPDTAPSLSTWGNTSASGTVVTATVGGTPVVLGTGAAGVSDVQIDALVAASAANNYDHTVLTVRRDGTANADDHFGGAGNAATGLFFNAGAVDLNGVQIGTFTQAGGTLAITFNATAGVTKAEIQTVLNSLTFTNSGAANQLTSGILIDATLADANTQAGTTAGDAFQGTGGVKTSAPVQVLIDLAPTPTSGAFADPNDTAASGAAVILAPGIVLTDAANLSQVVLTISANHHAGEDVLAFTPNAATFGDIRISGGSFNDATGTLTLTSAGGATLAQWQAALRSVQYYDSSNTPTTGTRTISFATTDRTGGGTLAGTLATVSVAADNDSPVLNGTAVSIGPATENGGAPAGAVGTLVSALAGNGNVTDTDGANAHDGSTPGAVGIAIVGADTTDGTWYYSTDNGAHWTAFASSALTAISGTNALHLVADANTRIYFQPTVANANGVISDALTIRGWDQFDGAANGSLSALPTDSALGSGTNTNASAYSAATEVLPLAITATGSASFIEPNDTAAAAAAIAVDGAAVLIGGDTYSAATITITNAEAEDHLVFTANPATMGDITIGTNANGVLTLTSTGGATAAQFQAALQAVRYYDSSDTPSTTTRTLTLTVHDSTTNATVSIASPALSIAASNDSPVLAATAVALNDATEDSGAPPNNAANPVGTLVSQLTAGITDTDANNLHDGLPATPAAVGIAVTAADTTEGSWYYSTNGGATWTLFASAANGLAGGSALHLVADANTRLYFDPNPNFNGTVANALTFRAWDQFDAVANGTVSALPTDGVLGAGINTLSSAYSAATKSIDLIADAVNDAPIASGTATLATTTEDTAGPPGDTVAHLFGGNFSDSADQQQSVGNPTGSVANTLAGIAITGNAATAAEGSWQYSTDNGAHWTAIATTGLADTRAIVLPSSAELRFVPTANFNGVPGALTTRLIDSSTQTVTAGVTGQDLSTGTTAFSGVDVSTNGGITAVSAGTVALDTTVAAVNDAPVASGSAALAVTAEDTASPPGDTVAHLFGGNFDDGTDQQQTVGNPTGSVANPLAGIAVVGNAATAGQGVWQYSTDNGAHWTTIATTGLADASALILPASADLRFLPVANFNGVPGGLSTRLIDSSTQTVTTGVTGQDLSTGTTAFTGVDVSGANDGGTTAVSAATVALNTAVTAVNDAPIASGSAAVPASPEDTANPGGTTVASLLGQSTVNYSDAADTVTTAVSGGSVGTPAAAIAITGNGATPDQGSWQYSTDNGATWTAIATNPSDTAAVVIPGSAELRFVPQPNFNGVPGGLTAHVSDGTALPVTGVTDISATEGGTGGWSAGTITLGTTVAAVNDAPIASGSAAVPSTPEDTASPAGTTVSSLLGQTTVNYSDAVDTVTTAVSGGSVGTPAAAIAITGNSATPDQGSWQYSTDNGAHWTTIPSTGLGDTNAIIIPTSADLRFVPQPNYNGVPGGLTAHISDGTNLPAAGPADISGSEGGTGGWSSGTISLGTTVTAVNDAPVASGSATLAPVSPSNQSNQGDTISDLFGGNFSDTADQQHSAANPTGSSANTLAGIAITGDTAGPGQGVWQYSTDNGAHWTTVPTSVSDTNAIIVPATGSLRFVPANGFNGAPGGLSVHLVDSSVGTLTGAVTGVDASQVGGSSAFSAAPVLLSTQVQAVIGVPILASTPFASIVDDVNPDGSTQTPQYEPTPPAADHGSETDDFLHRPILPQVSLIGSVGNRFVIAEQEAIIAVPSNLFQDTYPGATLVFEAKDPAGGSLPGWLQFDARNLTFTGTPPASSYGAIDVLIVAKDQYGNEATASFRILVGREQEDLLHLLSPRAGATTGTPPIQGQPASNGNTTVPHRHTPVRQPIAPSANHAALAPGDLAHRQDGSIDGMFASLAQPAHAGRQAHSAFSAQLREAGPIGRLSQARQLLETIAKTVSSKPAA